MQRGWRAPISGRYRGFYNPAVPRKCNVTPAFLDVGVKTPVEPCKSSRVVNRAREGPSPSQLSIAAWWLLPDTKVSWLQWKGRRRRRFIQRMVTPSPCIVLLWKMSWLYLTTSLIATSARLQCRLRVCELCTWWLDSKLTCPSGLCNEALKQLYKTKYLFLEVSCIDHYYWTAVFFNDRDVRYAEICLVASDHFRAVINGSSGSRTSEVVDESQLGTTQWL